MKDIKAIITGATGMVGKGVLLECLAHSSVTSVLVVNRQPINIKHPKLVEIIHNNFFDLSPIEESFKGYNACFFCLGISSFRMREKDYEHITYDLTLHVAQTLLKLNAEMTFCYVSGQGTDSTEKGRTMWARVKGKTENDLLAMPFNAAYMFRPGYIHPMHGIKSRTPLYNIAYAIMKPLYPLLKTFFSNGITTNQAMGRAMIAVILKGYDKRVLVSRDINLLAQY